MLAKRRATRPESPRRADAYGQIDAVLDEVDIGVLQAQVELQPGVLFHQPHQQRQQHAPPIDDRRIDAQHAGRGGARAGRFGLQVIDLGQDPLATVEEPLAVTRQRDLAGRAVEQLDAQGGLEASHGLGQRRRRDTVFARRRGEAAVLGRCRRRR